jgi:hypothetical protein
MATAEQHEKAQKSRVRAIGASIVAGVLWIASLLPIIVPSLNSYLTPHWQQELARFAGLVTAIAAFLAKDSGAAQIPKEKS